MSRPLIGITVDTADDNKQYESPMAYARAVEKAGGVPVLLPYNVDFSVIPVLLDRLDGIVLSGGPDLNPNLYGETYHPGTWPVDPRRQRFEFALLEQIEKRRTPVLGVCLGSQVMNTYRGGSLDQFLPELSRDNPIEHRKLSSTEVRHPVKLVTGTIAHELLGKSEVLANSSHKQAVKKLGRGLRINAMSPDGVIEGTEDPTFPLWLGVQWHPERLNDEPDHLAFFKLLVARSSK